MSAITGIFNRNGMSVKSESIKQINNRLSHRGPDGSAVWTDGAVALGHQMLWTTPESLHEKLPFHDNKTGLTITADARIDNRIELAEHLHIENKEDIADSYFILKSYEKWGEKCPEYLLGDFAFVIWDENEKKLFCARDHMGIKPFYYYIDKDIFVFGTEIKALLSVPTVPYKLNKLKVALYLMDIEDNRLTFFENIFIFPSAHSITIKQNDTKKRKYWELDPEFNIFMTSDEDYAKTFREIFDEAVECRLRSAYPIGFELSGGLDSSSIVNTAKNIYKNNNITNNLNTFSIIYKNFPECDESVYIQSIIDTGKIDAHYILGDDIKPFDQIDTILEYQEQPFFSPNMVNIWKFYQKMHEKNMRIVLSGNGGDSVISFGTNYFRDLLVGFKWKKLIYEIDSYSKHSDKGFTNLFLTFLINSLIPQNLKEIIHPYNKRRPGTDVLNKKFADRIKAENYLEDLHWRPFLEANTAKKNHYFSLSTDNLYFLEMLDRTSAVFSEEIRYPYLDKRIVEFCYAIPTEIKFKNGWYRYIQRIAMENILPKKNQWRHKGPSLTALFDKNLLLSEKDRLNDIISSNNQLLKEYVDLERMEDIYQERLVKGSPNYASTDIWLASILFLWLNKSENIG